jgi:hypothetical protein
LFSCRVCEWQGKLLVSRRYVWVLSKIDTWFLAHGTIIVAQVRMVYHWHWSQVLCVLFVHHLVSNISSLGQ